MITERTCYQPKPGRFDEVLRARRWASEVRIGLGLAAGTIYSGETGRGPMVFWECRFATDAEHQADLAAREASPEFEQVRQTMRELLVEFDRQVIRPDLHPSPTVVVNSPLDGGPVVPEEVTFPSGGLSLKGYLYRPPGEGPFPCLVTNHGSTINQGTTDICRPGVAAVLLSWGIASLLPHRRGYGNSPGTPWRDQVSADFGTEAYDQALAVRLDQESDDVVAALDWLTKSEKIDAGHVGVIGSSFGGTVTLLAAAKEPRFRCAVEFAGAAMNWDQTPRLRATMHAAAKRLTQPIFFLQAANDYSARPTLELAAALEGTDQIVQSKVYPGFGLTKDEGHQLYADGPALWSPDVRRFLERWL